MSARWVRAADVAWLDVDDEVVLWKDTVLHRLDPLAARVWGRLAEPSSPEDLVAAAGGSADLELVRDGVLGLLDRLQAAGLVTESAAPYGPPD